MTVLVRVVAGILLPAHGLVHLLYLGPDAQDPDFPFTLRASWIVPQSVRRPVAIVSTVGTVAAFAALALAVWGVRGLAPMWPGTAVVAAAVSPILLLAFWDLCLTFGVVIDLALAAAVVVRPEWTEGWPADRARECRRHLGIIR